jgi:hypothetical protein
MNREGESRTLANALDQLIDSVWCERAAPVGRKNEAAVGELAAQLPECPDLVAPRLVAVDSTMLILKNQPLTLCR